MNTRRQRAKLLREARVHFIALGYTLLELQKAQERPTGANPGPPASSPLHPGQLDVEHCIRLLEESL
jgi:hypothetical protein